MNKTHRSERNEYCNNAANVEEFSESLEHHGKHQRDGQEYPDHGSLLLHKRNIPNLLIIRNACMKHVLGKRRTDVAKASRGAAHFLAVRRDHPLGRRYAAGERRRDGNSDNNFVHRKLLLGKAALTNRNIKPLLAKVKFKVT